MKCGDDFICLIFLTLSHLKHMSPTSRSVSKAIEIKDFTRTALSTHSFKAQCLNQHLCSERLLGATRLFRSYLAWRRHLAQWLVLRLAAPWNRLAGTLVAATRLPYAHPAGPLGTMYRISWVRGGIPHCAHPKLRPHFPLLFLSHIVLQTHSRNRNWLSFQKWKRKPPLRNTIFSGFF